jgi:hypothetical protein
VLEQCTMMTLTRTPADRERQKATERTVDSHDEPI